MAGVEPRFQLLEDGKEPKAFILSANIARRHLSKGQQAMAVAMLYPEPERGGRGRHQSSAAENQVSAGRLSKARAVLRFSRELAERVLTDRTYSLDKAFAEIERAW
jgi:hypothetical protein